MIKQTKIKLLIVGPDSPHVANFVNRFDTNTYNLQVISSGKRYITYKNNLRVNFSLIKFWNFLFTPLKIKKIAHQFEPDVVWLHQANSFSLYPILALKKKYPIILTVWGSDILVAPKKSWWIRRMTRYILSKVDLITADAKFLGEQAIELIPKANIPLHICQFGINPIDISPEKEKVIFSNRGHKSLYRINEVILAFHRFQSNSTANEWKLLIAGEGPETLGLQKLVDELKLTEKVQFIGFLSAFENANWYSRSTYYISIPESDGTAVSLLEAMYYGCIPIVSDLPANKEWIHHTENGYVVSDLKENFLAEAMKMNSSTAIATNKAMINKTATPEACTQKFEEAIEAVLFIKKETI